MKPITLIETLDGARFHSVDDALKHLDKLYGDLLCSVARDLLHVAQGGKAYTLTAEYIDLNLEVFAKLKRLKNDMKLEGVPDET